MTVAQAIILGIVQGLTEFIPVSSTAHLWLVQSFMHLDVDGTAFDIVLHLGTAVALIINFYRGLGRMFREFVRWTMRKPPIDAEDRALILPLIVGTVPAAVLGVLFLKGAEHLRTHQTIGVTMIIGALLFILAESSGGEPRVPAIGDAFFIGIVEGIAGLFPGLSRSGSTISAGMITGLRRDCAARFSFLLALPIILGAGAKTFVDVHSTARVLPSYPSLLAGFVAAAVVGTVVIRFLLRYLASHTLLPFAVYLFILGSALLALSAMGVLRG